MTAKKLFLYSLLAGIFALSHPALAQDAKDKLTLSTVKKDGKVLFYAHNTDPWSVIHVKLEMTITGDSQFSAPLPLQILVPPGKDVLLGSVSFGSGRASYSTNYHYDYGDPDATQDPRAVYLFPYEHGVKHGIIQGYFGSLTHQTCQCLDFDLEENSPICAARAGLVVTVKEDSNIGGPGHEFAKDGNYVKILHADGTWARYVHLRQNGATVEPGQQVKAGEIIGYSGHTGMAVGPHLHFEVNRASWGAPATTLATTFLTQAGQVSPVNGNYYYSFHPGGAAFKEVHGDMYTETLLDQFIQPAPLNGAVTVRSRELESRTLLYASNGTGRDQTLTLSFSVLENLTSSKTLPFSKLIPAGKEVYLLSIQRKDLANKSRFGYTYSYH